MWKIAIIMMVNNSLDVSVLNTEFYSAQSCEIAKTKIVNQHDIGNDDIKCIVDLYDVDIVKKPTKVA